MLNIRESYEDWEFVIEFTREKNWGKTAQREACAKSLFESECLGNIVQFSEHEKIQLQMRLGHWGAAKGLAEECTLTILIHRMYIMCQGQWK